MIYLSCVCNIINKKDLIISKATWLKTKKFHEKVSGKSLNAFLYDKSFLQIFHISYTRTSISIFKDG